MEMQPVTSSAVEAIGWEDDVMYVEYKNGNKYRYDGVSYAEYESVRDSSSIGRALQNLGTRGVAC